MYINRIVQEIKTKQLLKRGIVGGTGVDSRLIDLQLEPRGTWSKAPKC